MKRLLVLLAVVGLVAATGVPAGADHSWNGYHWPNPDHPSELTVNLVDSMTSDWDAFLGPVSADWTASVLNTPVVAGSDSSRTRKRCPTTSGQVRVCNAAYGFNGWLGIAEIWIQGGHIVKSRARVNDSYFSHPAYNDPHAKRHVLCQEVGHTLGLDHQNAKSCMDDVNGLFDPGYVSPNAHDYAELAAIYNHKDASGSGTKGKGNGQGGGNGRGTVVVERGGGGLHVTWIFWAS